MRRQRLPTNHDTGKLAGLSPSASLGRMQRQSGECVPVPTHPATLLALTLQATRCGQNFPKPRGGWIRLSKVTTSKCLILPLQRQQTASAMRWQTWQWFRQGLGGFIPVAHPVLLWWANPYTSLCSPCRKQLFPGTGQQIKGCSGMGRVGSIAWVG